MKINEKTKSNVYTASQKHKYAKLSGKVVKHIDSRQFQDDDGIEDYYNFDNEVDNHIKLGTSQESLPKVLS